MDLELTAEDLLEIEGAFSNRNTMNPNILSPVKIQAVPAGLHSNLKKFQKATRLALLGFASLLAFSVANAAPSATHPTTHNDPIKKKCYCARTSDSADRADLNAGALHFNMIDGQPIR